jgi:hypothetical protein
LAQAQARGRGRPALLNAGENAEATDPLLPEDAIGRLLIHEPGRRATRRLARAPGSAVRLDTIAALQGDDEERA